MKRIFIFLVMAVAINSYGENLKQLGQYIINATDGTGVLSCKENSSWESYTVKKYFNGTKIFATQIRLGNRHENWFYSYKDNCYVRAHSDWMYRFTNRYNEYHQSGGTFVVTSSDNTLDCFSYRDLDSPVNFVFNTGDQVYVSNQNVYANYNGEVWMYTQRNCYLRAKANYLGRLSY